MAHRRVADRERRPPALVAVVDEMFDDDERYGTTYAVAVVQGGRLLLERYGGALPHFDRPPEPVEPAHAAAVVVDGEVRAARRRRRAGGGGPAGASTRRPGVPGWTDERAAITLDQLLQMRDGLRWAEDYVDAGVSDVIEMLFGSGQDDVAAYAEARPLAHPPGTVFNYSSGTSNIVAAILGPDGRHRRRRAPASCSTGCSTRSACARPTPASTPPARSSARRTSTPPPRTGPASARCTSATACGTARRILPEGWVDHGRRVRSVDPTDGSLYGAHWWIDQLDTERGTFRASGYEGQAVAICPALDAVVVRLGRTPEPLAANLPPWRRRVFDALS